MKLRTEELPLGFGFQSERDCERAIAHMKVWDGFLNKLFGV